MGVVWVRNRRRRQYRKNQFDDSFFSQFHKLKHDKKFTELIKAFRSRLLDVMGRGYMEVKDLRIEVN